MSSGRPVRYTSMSYADVNGLSLHYEEHGRGGEPLIMLHGGCRRTAEPPTSPGRCGSGRWPMTSPA
jgi:hypothetical protein